MPTHSIEQPCRSTVVVDNETYDIVYWGLPRESPEVRKRRLQEISIASVKAKHAATKQLVSQAKKAAHADVDIRNESQSDVFADFELDSKGEIRLRTRKQGVKDAQAQKATVEQRERRNANRERLEKIAKISNVRDQLEHQEREDRETAEERRNARRRSGRRAS